MSSSRLKRERHKRLPSALKKSSEELVIFQSQRLNTDNHTLEADHKSGTEQQHQPSPASPRIAHYQTGKALMRHRKRSQPYKREAVAGIAGHRFEQLEEAGDQCLAHRSGRAPPNPVGEWLVNPEQHAEHRNQEQHAHGQNPEASAKPAAE